MTARPRTYRRCRAAAPTLLVAFALNACGDDAGFRADPAPAPMTAAPSTEPEATAEPARRPAGTRLRAIGSQFGRIVGDGPGLAVYIFDKERRGRSECYGACAKAWPPVLAKGRPVAGRGIDPELLGTTRRRGGKRQLTYRGQPLYYYEHDRPGLVLCHDVFEFGGTWLVIRPNGRAVP
jgi:predicted lipoprotein with Yx(FWY)xxD motif